MRKKETWGSRGNQKKEKVAQHKDSEEDQALQASLIIQDLSIIKNSKTIVAGEVVQKKEHF